MSQSHDKPGRVYSRRELFRLLALAGGGMALAACGDAQPTPTPPPPTKRLTATPRPTPSERTPIAYWQYLIDFEKLESRLFDVYGKRFPAIDVRPAFIAPEEYWGKLDAALAAGNGPDVWNATPWQMWRHALGGQLADVTELLKRDFEMTLAVGGLYTASLELFKLGAVHFGVPRDLSLAVAYLNKDLLGSQMPEDSQWSWGDMLTHAKAVTSGKTWGCEPFGDVRLLDAVIRSNGGQPFKGEFRRDLEGMESGYGSGAACETAEWLLDLVHAEKVAPMPDAGENGDLFATGKAAIAFGFPARMLALEDVPFAWDILPLPAGSAAQFTLGDSHGLVLNVATASPSHSWDLALWLTDPGTGKGFLEALNTMPVLVAYAEAPDFLDRLEGQNMGAFVQSADMAVENYTLGYQAWKAAQQEAWDLALGGETPRDKACTAMDQVVDAAWAEIRG